MKIKRTKKNVAIMKYSLLALMIIFCTIWAVCLGTERYITSIPFFALSAFFGYCFGELDELSAEWFDTEEEKEEKIKYVYTIDEWENQ